MPITTIFPSGDLDTEVMSVISTIIEEDTAAPITLALRNRHMATAIAYTRIKDNSSTLSKYLTANAISLIDRPNHIFGCTNVRIAMDPLYCQDEIGESDRITVRSTGFTIGTES